MLAKKASSVLVSLVSLVSLVGLALLGQGVAGADEWKEYNSADGHFTVDFPGTPKQSKEKHQTKFGSLDTQLLTLAASKDVFYGISFGDYPDSIIKAHRQEELLDDAVNSAVKNVKGGRIQAQEKISLAGVSGRELVVDTPGGLRMTVRLFMVKSRLYQVLSAVGKGKEKDADPKRFLDSFKLAG
jgi:hypothetical protein